MIMILLNLAFIPDSVITDNDMNFEPGWQHYFKLRMKNYIDDFNNKGGNSEKYELVQKGETKYYTTEVSSDETIIPGKTHTLNYDTQFDF